MSIMSDRREVENKTKSGGQEEEEEKDQISLVSFLEASNIQHISFVLLRFGLKVFEHAYILLHIS